jgi:hypothetical protein
MTQFYSWFRFVRPELAISAVLNPAASPPDGELDRVENDYYRFLNHPGG